MTRWEDAGSEESMTEIRQDASPDFTIEQNWQDYSEDEHAIWRLLFERQQRLLVGRACREFLEGLGGLGVAADGIPDFRRLSEVLDAATGWRIVAVPGLVPDDVFFSHLAHRRFPSTCFIRRRDQLDYLQEPDVFHDICGHVPLLMNPVFADYMQAYGEGGLKALGLGHLQRLARLYWYTVEFGLIATLEGLRIYGSSDSLFQAVLRGLAQPSDELGHIVDQASEMRLLAEGSFIHVERPVDLDLQRVTMEPRASVVAGREPAGIG